MDLISLGSATAKAGFKNEEDVINNFNNWHANGTAQQWLKAMGYNLPCIEHVYATKVKGSFKTDVSVQITITVKLNKALDCQNISVKLVSNKRGFNQIDKRWLSKYQELWNIPNDILILLKHYTGELAPCKANTKDSRRMFAHEFTKAEQNKIITFLQENKTLILADILKGRGKFAAEWLLVIVKNTGENSWVLQPMNQVLNYYIGDVYISSRGTFHIGKVTMQRKGGDGGRPTANMLQFKIDPMELLALTKK